ncbi:MAG: polysaccharide biosynthesis tyrosine autokinase [Myxococcota bacterium]
MSSKPHDPAAVAGAPGGRQLDMREILRAVWAYKWLVLVLCLVVGAGATVFTVRQPKMYQATCSLEYDPNPPRPLGDAVDDVASQGSEFWGNREFYETQNRIIASRSIAERVVRQLELHHDPEFAGVPEERRAGWQGRTVEAAARDLQSRLVVDTVRGTRLVLIRVTDGNPERAAALANAVADVYVEKTMEDRLNSTVTALEWLHEQLDSLRGQLHEAEIALHDFKREHNVLSVSLEDRQNLVATEMQAFNEMLTKARSRRIELGARLRQLRRAEGENPEDFFAPNLENSAIDTLRAAVNEKLALRESLGVRYGENHESMQQNAREIAELRRQLQQEIDGQVRGAEREVAAAREVENGLRSALETANQAGLELNLQEIRYRRLDRNQENKAKLYQVVLERTTETDLTRMLQISHVRIVDRALQPRSHISPNVPLNIAGGVLLGLLLGLGLALALAFTDARIKSVEAVEELGLTIVGILPRIASPGAGRSKGRKARQPQSNTNFDTVVHTHPRSSMAEACRSLRTNLTFLAAEKPLRTLLVTSPSPAEGKTTVAINLAIALAQGGKRVLLVDSDLRRPRLHKTFRIRTGTGLTSMLVGGENASKAVASTDIPGLSVLPCGPIPPNPAELLLGSRFGELLEELQNSYDTVIFDSPPLGPVTDATVIGPQVDGVLVVLRAGQTHRKAVMVALRQLRDVSARIVGGVLNGIDTSDGRYGYAGYYYYQQYYGTDDNEPEEPRLVSSA